MVLRHLGSAMQACSPSLIPAVGGLAHKTFPLSAIRKMASTAGFAVSETLNNVLRSIGP